MNMFKWAAVVVVVCFAAISFMAEDLITAGRILNIGAIITGVLCLGGSYERK